MIQYRDLIARLSISLRKNLPRDIDRWRYVDNGYFLNSSDQYITYILYQIMYHGVELEARLGTEYCRTTKIALDIRIRGYQACINYYFVQHTLKYLLDQHTLPIPHLHYLDVLDFVKQALSQSHKQHIIQAFDKNLHEVAYQQATQYLTSNLHNSTIDQPRASNIVAFPRHKHNAKLLRRYA